MSVSRRGTSGSTFEGCVLMSLAHEEATAQLDGASICEAASIPPGTSVDEPGMQELASLVRRWVALASIVDAQPCEPEVGTGHRLFLFVRDRLAERVGIALEAGDALTQRFTTWEMDWVDRGWGDAATHPHGLEEMERYLRRSARRYRRHPQFDLAWRLPRQAPTDRVAAGSAV